MRPTRPCPIRSPKTLPTRRTASATARALGTLVVAAVFASAPLTVTAQQERETAALKTAPGVPSIAQSDGRTRASPPARPEPTVEVGIASVYSADLEDRPTASGEPYDSGRLTAAHRSLPIGTRLKITDPGSGRSVRVVVNDRWGGGPNQIVNLSRRAASELGMGASGQRKVQLEVEALGDGRRMPPAPEGTTTRQVLPERIEADAGNAAGRTKRCQNEAKILGLKDEWFERHVKACVARKSKPGA